MSDTNLVNIASMKCVRAGSEFEFGLRLNDRTNATATVREHSGNWLLRIRCDGMGVDGEVQGRLAGMTCELREEDLELFVLLLARPLARDLLELEL